MAVRLICEGTKVVGVETIPSPKPKRGMAVCAHTSALLFSLSYGGGGFHSDSSGVVQRHFAREEVILSAGPVLRKVLTAVAAVLSLSGAVGSPQLLMTSGIGDAKAAILPLQSNVPQSHETARREADAVFRCFTYWVGKTACSQPKVSQHRLLSYTIP